MTTKRYVREARNNLVQLQEMLGALQMVVGETVMRLHRAELALDGGNLDLQKERAQEVLDALPRLTDEELEMSRESIEE